MAASPLPREPLSGTCNTSGNATITYRAPAHYYVHIYVAIQVSSGNPNYALTLGTASPLIFGTGNQSQLGPVLLQPGERMTIQITGAGASATVIGQVMGWQASQPEELMPLLPIQPTAVAISNTLSTPAFIQVQDGLPTYRAANRTVASFPLSTDTQWVAFYHTTAAISRLRIRRIRFSIDSSSVAATLVIKLARLTGGSSPAGGTAVVWTPVDTVDISPAPFESIFDVPATPGAVEANLRGIAGYSLAISAATADTSKLTTVPFYEHSLQGKGLTMNAGVAGGWVLVINPSATTTLGISWEAEATVG